MFKWQWPFCELAISIWPIALNQFNSLTLWKVISPFLIIPLGHCWEDKIATCSCKKGKNILYCILFLRIYCNYINNETNSESQMMRDALCVILLSLIHIYFIKFNLSSSIAMLTLYMYFGGCASFSGASCCVLWLKKI